MHPRISAANISALSPLLGDYKSGALAAVHETAAGLNAAGAIDMHSMKAFDEMCRIRLVRRRARPSSPATSM